MAYSAAGHAAIDMPIACTLTAEEQATWSEGLGCTVFGGYEKARELPDKYALRYPGDDAWIQTLVEFIAHERDCCTFFTFGLVFEPDHGAVWLHLNGNEDVKTFVEGMIARIR